MRKYSRYYSHDQKSSEWLLLCAGCVRKRHYVSERLLQTHSIFNKSLVWLWV